MIGANIDFVPSIRSHATAGNRELSDEEISSLNTTLNSLADISGAEPTLSFSLGGDQRGDLLKALDFYGQGFGRPATKSQSTPTVPAGANATQRAVALNQAAKTAADTLKHQQAVQFVKSFGNPWKSQNRTHQAYVTNIHPTLATQLKSEAGIK